MGLLAGLHEFFRCMVTNVILVLPRASSADPAGDLDRAIDEAARRFPQERIFQESKALAEKHTRAVLGRRGLDS